MEYEMTDINTHLTSAFSNADKNILKSKLMKYHEKLPNGCWQWKRSVTKSGYGMIEIQGISIYIHRASMLVFKPEEYSDILLVLHKCNNRKCINPDHLYSGTGSDNNRDSAQSGGYESRVKTHCHKGHEYTPENTYIEPASGHKRCKICLQAKELFYQSMR